MRFVTHNGKIHSDEVCAIALLTAYFNHKGYDVSVLRTRDDINFLPTDILIDIGLEYNHDDLKYDHHQSDFKETWSSDDTIPLSCAGLIWKHYGTEIIEMYLTNNSEDYDHAFNYTEETIQELKNRIYYNLLMDIDAHDNGIVHTNTDLNISSLVSALNTDITNDEVQNDNFNQAVDLVSRILDIKFKEIINSYLTFQKDLEIVSQMDLSGPYIVIHQNIPTIFKCISKLDVEHNVKFCIFVKENEYTIKTMREENNKFTPICPILSEEILKSSIPDIIFVHKAGFLARTKTLESAKEIINMSLLNCINIDLETKVEPIRRINMKKYKIIGGVVVTTILTLGLVYWIRKD